ncbi:hypothetical protein GCM10027176_21090 [Actinoallomurus bryophytorum]
MRPAGVTPMKLNLIHLTRASAVAPERRRPSLMPGPGWLRPGAPPDMTRPRTPEAYGAFRHEPGWAALVTATATATASAAPAARERGSARWERRTARRLLL